MALQLLSLWKLSLVFYLEYLSQNILEGYTKDNKMKNLIALIVTTKQKPKNA